MHGGVSPAQFLVGVVGLGGNHDLSIMTYCNHGLHIIDPLKNIYQMIGGGYILEPATDDFLGLPPKKFYI